MNEGKLGHLERASVLAASDDPKDQDKAREIKTRFDYESLKRQIGSKKKPSKPAVNETTSSIKVTVVFSIEPDVNTLPLGIVSFVTLIAAPFAPKAEPPTPPVFVCISILAYSLICLDSSLEASTVTVGKLPVATVESV